MKVPMSIILVYLKIRVPMSMSMPMIVILVLKMRVPNRHCLCLNFDRVVFSQVCLMFSF